MSDKLTYLLGRVMVRKDNGVSCRVVDTGYKWVYVMALNSEYKWMPPRLCRLLPATLRNLTKAERMAAALLGVTYGHNTL